MIKKLIKLANELDQLGLKKEADYLDCLIKKTAFEGGDRDPGPSKSPYVMIGRSGAVTRGDISSTRWQANKYMKALGVNLPKEESAENLRNAFWNSLNQRTDFAWDWYLGIGDFVERFDVYNRVEAALPSDWTSLAELGPKGIKRKMKGEILRIEAELHSDGDSLFGFGASIADGNMMKSAFALFYIALYGEAQSAELTGRW